MKNEKTKSTDIIMLQTEIGIRSQKVSICKKVVQLHRLVAHFMLQCHIAQTCKD